MEVLLIVTLVLFAVFIHPFHEALPQQAKVLEDSNYVLPQGARFLLLLVINLLHKLLMVDGSRGSCRLGLLHLLDRRRHRFFLHVQIFRLHLQQGSMLLIMVLGLLFLSLVGLRVRRVVSINSIHLDERLLGVMLRLVRNDSGGRLLDAGQGSAICLDRLSLLLSCRRC